MGGEATSDLSKAPGLRNLSGGLMKLAQRIADPSDVHHFVAREAVY